MYHVTKTPNDLVNELVHPGEEVNILLRRISRHLPSKSAYDEVVDGLAHHLVGKNADKAARADRALVGLGEESITHLLTQIETGGDCPASKRNLKAIEALTLWAPEDVRDVAQRWLCQFVRVQEVMPPATRSQAMIDVAGLAAMFEFGFQPGDPDEVRQPTPGRVADRLTDAYLELTDALDVEPDEAHLQPQVCQAVGELRRLIWALRSWDGVMLEKSVADEEAGRPVAVASADDPKPEETR